VAQSIDFEAVARRYAAEIQRLTAERDALWAAVAAWQAVQQHADSRYGECWYCWAGRNCRSRDELIERAQQYTVSLPAILVRHAAEQAVIAAARAVIDQTLGTDAWIGPPQDVLENALDELDRLAATPTPAAETEAPTP
jgi:hypothetical protein